jgi:hypothetical protein
MDQPRTNLVKNEKCDLLGVPHKILNRWQNYFCQLLNFQEAGDDGQSEMHAAEPSASEVEITVGKLKSYKSPGADQIPEEIIRTGGREITF